MGNVSSRTTTQLVNEECVLKVCSVVSSRTVVSSHSLVNLLNDREYAGPCSCLRGHETANTRDIFFSNCHGESLPTIKVAISYSYRGRIVEGSKFEVVELLILFLE